MKYEIRNLIVKGGTGGNGRASFATGRKGYIGRPDGGPGGNGGSVSAIGSEDEWWLSQIDGMNQMEGEEGTGGGRNDRIGKAGRERVIIVPVGTEIWKKEGNRWEQIGDVTEHGQKVLLARGGQRGRGNRAFTTAENQAPMLAEAGGKGDTLEVSLVVKRMVDIALIGPPNSGKSTLLNRLSNAAAIVAAHPFSTQEPVLGVVEWKGKRFTIVDLPPLIKDAHSGRGLGNSFLRHAERAAMIMYVLDGEGDDWLAQYRTLVGEVTAYSSALGTKPSAILVNRKDAIDTGIAMNPDWAALENEAGSRALVIYSKNGEGEEQILDVAADAVPFTEGRRPNSQKGAIEESLKTPRPPDDHMAVRKDDDVFIVTNEAIERIAAGSNLNEWSARIQLNRLLDGKGILKLLEANGARPGDTIHIGPVELEWS